MQIAVMKRNLQGVLKNVKHDVLKIIFKHISRNDCVVFLYGSLVEGKIANNADIDIGIFCHNEIQQHIMSLIRTEVEEKARTLREIDVIDFSNIKENEFLNVAFKRIRLWHEGKNMRECFAEFRSNFIQKNNIDD